MGSRQGIGAWFMRVLFGTPEQRLIQAASKQDLAGVEKLLADGADANGRNETGDTALMFAAANGSLPVVRALLAAGADVNAKNTEGWQPLMGAAGKSHVEVMRALLDAGANVNARANNGAAPLYFVLAAPEPRYMAAAATLLAAGADPNIADNEEGLTALIIAAEDGRDDLVRLLLEKGARANIRAKDGSTALSRAKKNYSPGGGKAVKLLKQWGVRE